jgi:hypothetical protein
MLSDGAKNMRREADAFTTALDIITHYRYHMECCQRVLYECEVWSLALRVEHRLRVFEDRMLRR